MSGAIVWTQIPHNSGGPIKDKTNWFGNFRLKGLPEKHRINLTVDYQGYRWKEFRKIETGQEDLELQIFPSGYELYGEPAPKLLIEKWFNTEPLELSELRGKVILMDVGVNIGKSTQNVTLLKSMSDKYKKDGLITIAVHQAFGNGWPKPATNEEVVAYLKKHNIQIPFAVDLSGTKTPPAVKAKGRNVVNGATYNVYDGGGIYLIDKKGMLRCAPTEKNLAKWVSSLIEE